MDCLRASRTFNFCDKWLGEETAGPQTKATFLPFCIKIIKNHPQVFSSGQPGTSSRTLEGRLPLRVSLFLHHNAAQVFFLTLVHNQGRDEGLASLPCPVASRSPQGGQVRRCQ